jgi:hypothetical protein
MRTKLKELWVKGREGREYHDGLYFFYSPPSTGGLELRA